MAVIADRPITRPAANAASDVTGRTPGEIFILTWEILCSCVILHFHCKLDIACLILIKYTFSLPKPDDSFCQSTFSINGPRKVQGGGAQHHVQCQPRVIITLRRDCYRCGNLFCGARFCAISTLYELVNPHRSAQNHTLVSTHRRIYCSIIYRSNLFMPVAVAASLM